MIKRQSRMFADWLHNSCNYDCAKHAGVAKTLELLRPYLIDECPLPTHGPTTEKTLREAHRLHSEATTPYGPVVRTINLPIPGQPRTWEVVDPLAYIHYLSTVSSDFRSMIASAVRQHQILRYIMYIDEITPRNPLRPDPARTVQAIYWTFLELPSFVLKRSLCWPSLGFLKSSTALKLPGGISHLMRIALELDLHACCSNHRNHMCKLCGRQMYIYIYICENT